MPFSSILVSPQFTTIAYLVRRFVLVQKQILMIPDESDDTDETDLEWMDDD